MTSLDDLIRYVRRGSSIGFWRLPVRAARDLDPATLGPYAVDLSAKADYAGPFDEDGVPLLNYYGSVGIQRNPCAVAQYALGLHERLRVTGDPSAASRFIRQADWLAGNLAGRSSGVRAWEYHFMANPSAYTVRIPWISAISQGQGISVLLRAHELTAKPSYLEAAHGAFDALRTPVAEDGLLALFEGGPFFEEVPSDPPSFILDGFLFCLFGVRDYSVVTRDPATRALLEGALDTAERCLPRYDAGFWSRGDLFRRWPPMLASPVYHRIHVAQLEGLFALTGRTAFRDYASRWKRFLRNPLYRAAAITSKVAFKVLYY